MPHLSPEDLARLVDEPGSPDEAAHLATCDDCTAELDAMRAEVRELARLGPLPPPAGAWDALVARLGAERVLQGDRAAWVRPLLRLAAALAIFALGGVTGALVRGGAAAAPEAVATRTEPATPAPLGPEARPVAGEESPEPAPVAGPEPGAAPRVADAGVASEGDDVPQPAGADLPSARTPEAAVRAVESAEQRYLTALTRYAELASPAAPEREAVARLAALESIVLTTRAALREAPADPVINGYHLAALAQRDAAIRQVASRGGDPWF